MVAQGTYAMGSLMLQDNMVITLESDGVVLEFAGDEATGSPAFFVAGQEQKPECDFNCAQNWFVAKNTDLNKLEDEKTRDQFPRADSPPSWEDSAIFPAGYNVHLYTYGGAQAKSLAFMNVDGSEHTATSVSTVPDYFVYPKVEVDIGEDAAHNCEAWFVGGKRMEPKVSDRHKCVASSTCPAPLPEDATAEEQKQYFDGLRDGETKLRDAAKDAAGYLFEEVAEADARERKVTAEISGSALNLRSCSGEDGFDGNFSKYLNNRLPAGTNVSDISITVTGSSFRFSAEGSFPRELTCANPDITSTCGNVGPVSGVADRTTDDFPTEIALTPDTTMQSRYAFYGAAEAMADAYMGFCEAGRRAASDVQDFRISLGASKYNTITAFAGGNLPQADVYTLANEDNSDAFIDYMCQGIGQMPIDDAVVGRVDCLMMEQDFGIVDASVVHEMKAKRMRRGEYGRATKLALLTVRYSIYGRGSDGDLTDEEKESMQSWIDTLTALYEPLYTSRPCYTAEGGIDYECLNTEMYAAANAKMASCGGDITASCRAGAEDAARDVCYGVSGCGPLGWKSPGYKNGQDPDDGECYDESSRGLSADICEADIKLQVDAAASANESGLPIIPIAAGAGGFVVLIVAILVLRNGGNDGKDSNRNVVAFENPMYDDPANAMKGGNGGGNEGLYDEPAFNSGSGAGKENPMYASTENVAADDGDGGGYLDVNPDDEESEEDYESEEDEDEDEDEDSYGSDEDSE